MPHLHDARRSLNPNPYEPPQFCPSRIRRPRTILWFCRALIYLVAPLLVGTSVFLFVSRGELFAAGVIYGVGFGVVVASAGIVLLLPPRWLRR